MATVIVLLVALSVIEISSAKSLAAELKSVEQVGVEGDEVGEGVTEIPSDGETTTTLSTDELLLEHKTTPEATNEQVTPQVVTLPLGAQLLVPFTPEKLPLSAIQHLPPSVVLAKPYVPHINDEELKQVVILNPPIIRVSSNHNTIPLTRVPVWPQVPYAPFPPVLLAPPLYPIHHSRMPIVPISSVSTPALNTSQTPTEEVSSTDKTEDIS